jgi:hypothetical protein
VSAKRYEQFRLSVADRAFRYGVVRYTNRWRRIVNGGDPTEIRGSFDPRRAEHPAQQPAKAGRQLPHAQRTALPHVSSPRAMT